jgi:hypothetical protein
MSFDKLRFFVSHLELRELPLWEDSFTKGMNATTLRKLKAKAILKDLSRRDISDISGVGYTQVSQVLNGRIVHPEYLKLIAEAIEGAPEPK